MPKDEWVHLLVTFNQNRWDIRAEYGPSWSNLLTDTFHVTETHVAWNDDTVGLYVIGGTEVQPSFKVPKYYIVEFFILYRSCKVFEAINQCMISR